MTLLPAENRHATPVARPAALTGRRWCTLAAASHDYGVRGVAYMRALVAEQQQNMFDHHQLIRARGNFSRSRPSPLLSPALCVCGQYGVVTTMRGAAVTS